MAIAFTTTQLQVINQHGSNILVSAAAGSGKTAVLVERIVRMICDEDRGIDIDRILVLTFTNAAAAEMRERIGLAIEERLAQNPENVHLQKQATLLHNAQITTIHSFSLFLLRNHFQEIGLDPAFRVADEGEIKLLKADVLEELLEEAFEKKEAEFLACVEYFCPGATQAALEKYILQLHEYAEGFPRPIDWLRERKEDYSVQTEEDLITGPCGEYLKHYMKQRLLGIAEDYARGIRLCEQPDGPYMYAELFESEKEMVEGLSAIEDVRALAEALSGIKYKNLSSKKDDAVDGAKKESAKAIRDKNKKKLAELTALLTNPGLGLSVIQSEECKKALAVLLDMTIAFEERLQEEKRAKKIIDFSDMEHYALSILWKKEDGRMVPSPVALEYRQFFKEILIDEYQDSNLVQENLLQAVSGEEEGNFNRFMVGDIKQSIYRFRLARPELFLEKYNSYKDEGDYQRIDLSQNFRSRTEVIDTVNRLFTHLMSAECGGLVYDEKAMLYPGAVYPEGTGFESELLLVDSSQVKKDEKKYLEARAVGLRIRDLLQTMEVFDKETKKMRKASYRDIVILLRTNSGWDDIYKKALEELDIPVFVASKIGYFQAVEVQELLNVLRVLSNPRQDIPLFGVMRSVFGGFSDEECAILRSSNREGCLYEAICAYGETENKDTALWERVERFRNWIAVYREQTVYLPIRELLQNLLETSDYLNYVTALPGGSKRRANVEMLLTRASDFEKTSYFGLFHFIRYMEQLEKYDVDYGEADSLDENADVVRIMSIHKSKGLEFPIAIVGGMGKEFNDQDSKNGIVLDVDLGVGINYVNAKNRLKNKSLRQSIILKKMRQDNLAEELRILYVALTRAKEKLIMAGSRDPEKGLPQETEQMNFSDFMDSKSYLDFVLPILHHTGITPTLLTAQDLELEEEKEQGQLLQKREQLLSSKAYVDEGTMAQLRQRFERNYPYSYLEGLYTKTTVSELKIAAMVDKDEAAYNAFEHKEFVPYIPAFRKEEASIDGAMRGNAFHKVMELLDFDYLLGEKKETLFASVREFLLQKVREGFLEQEYFEAVNIKKIVHFLESDLGERMCRAQREGRLYREQPFVLGISASRLKEEFPIDEQVLIQGIIDVFFVEEGEIVLLDYKTDRIDSMKALWKRYSVQLDYYAEALERLMDMPVKQRLLYSFALESYSENEE